MRKTYYLFVLFFLVTYFSFRNISIGGANMVLHLNAPKMTTIPIEFARGKIKVKGKIKIDHREYELNFLVDTGAPTIINTKFAERAGILFTHRKSIYSTPTGGIILSKEGGIIKQGILALGEAAIDFTSLKVAPLNNDSCEGIDAILGSDYLSLFEVSMDFKTDTLHLYNNALANGYDPLLTYPVKIKFHENTSQRTPLVRGTIDSIAMDFIWDTGFNSNFFLQYPSQKNMLFKKITAMPAIERCNIIAFTKGSLDNDDHAGDMYFGYVHDFALGGQQVIATRIFFGAQVNDNLFDERANIGTGFMKDYAVFIDWRRHLIGLKKQSLENSENGEIPDVVLKKTGDEGVFVSLINTTSVYYKKGLRVSDIVERVDDLETSIFLQQTASCMVNKELNAMVKKSDSITVKRGSAFITIIR